MGQRARDVAHLPEQNAQVRHDQRETEGQHVDPARIANEDHGQEDEAEAQQEAEHCGSAHGCERDTTSRSEKPRGQQEIDNDDRQAVGDRCSTFGLPEDGAGDDEDWAEQDDTLDEISCDLHNGRRPLKALGQRVCGIDLVHYEASVAVA